MQPLPASSQDSASSAPRDIVSTLKQGRSHKGTSTNSYSMYIRFLAMEDWFVGMSQEAVCEKYDTVSTRSLRRWLQEWGSGIYDECMEWSVVDLRNSKRMGGAGHPLEDPELEKLLLKFMKLKEDKQ